MKKTKDDVRYAHNVGSMFKRYKYDKSQQRQVLVSGIVDSIEITKHKNPFNDRCYHVCWSDGTKGWWSLESLKNACCG